MAIDCLPLRGKLLLESFAIQLLALCSDMHPGSEGMSPVRSLALALGAFTCVVASSPLLAQSQRNLTEPTTIIRGLGSPVRSQSGMLRIVVRDVDSPDQGITQVNVVISPDSGVTGRPTRSVAWNEQGLVPLVSLDTGSYVVLVRRVGYREARFQIRVSAACEQVLEVYLTQAIVFLDRCMVRTVGAPPCDPDPPLTPSRATFTTCARAG